MIGIETVIPTESPLREIQALLRYGRRRFPHRRLCGIVSVAAQICQICGQQLPAL